MLSRTGFVTNHAGMTACWCSKPHTETASSTCEVEYVALSSTIRKVMPLMQLLEDLKAACEIVTTLTIIVRKAFEDNQSFIAVVESKPPPTLSKHVTVKDYHFRGLSKK